MTGYDPRQTRSVRERLDVLNGLTDGVGGVRIGILQEGFDDADVEVRYLVLAAVDVLARAIATVSNVSIPEHITPMHRRTRWTRRVGYGGVQHRFLWRVCAHTYYPAGLLAAIDQMSFSHADTLSPRIKLNLIAGVLIRKNYNGRVYAKSHNVRPTFIKAYDAVLTGLHVLVMPTCLMTAPRNRRRDSYMEALEDRLSTRFMRPAKNTQPFNYTGHPALAVPVGKSSAGLPASMQLVGRLFDDPLLLRVAFAYEHSTDWGKIIEVGASDHEKALA